MNGSGKVLRNECEGLTVQSFKEQKTFSCGILDRRKQHPHTHRNPILLLLMAAKSCPTQLCTWSSRKKLGYY